MHNMLVLEVDELHEQTTSGSSSVSQEQESQACPVSVSLYKDIQTHICVSNLISTFFQNAIFAQSP